MGEHSCVILTFLDRGAAAISIRQRGFESASKLLEKGAGYRRS
jgi:hypothetical protein